MARPSLAGTLPPPVGLLSWRDAARYLSLSESSLRRLVKAGEVEPPIMVTEGRTAFPVEDVEAFRQKVIARARLRRQ